MGGLLNSDYVNLVFVTYIDTYVKRIGFLLSFNSYVKSILFFIMFIVFENFMSVFYVAFRYNAENLVNLTAVHNWLCFRFCDTRIFQVKYHKFSKNCWQWSTQGKAVFLLIVFFIKLKISWYGDHLNRFLHNFWSILFCGSKWF